MNAIFPGTFDPPTLGHMDVIQRASRICAKLTVAIPESNSKPTLLFTAQERADMLRRLCAAHSNVTVEVFSGLVADHCKKHKIGVIVRGLRSSNDIEFEFQMANANRLMSGVETLFIAASPGFSQISSTLIREIASSGKHLEAFLPEEIVEEIYQRSSK